MARVMVPQQRRTYNHNPRGSATAVVTMKGNNPFERALAGPEGLVRVQRGILPGMGYWGLGDDENTPSNPELFTLDPGGSAPAAVPSLTSFVPADLTSFAAPAALPDSATVAFPGDAAAIATTPPTMAPLTAAGTSPQSAPSATPVFQSTIQTQTAPSATGVPHAAAATAVPAASSSSFWAGLTSSILSAGAQVVTPLAANQLAKNKAAAAAGSAIKPFMPGTNVPAPKKSNTTTYVIVGVVGLVAIAGLVYFMKRK
jgi:hypothetical protein